ncbi:MAG: GTP-binding protein [Thermodesulfobacteriota bacterium]
MNLASILPGGLGALPAPRLPGLLSCLLAWARLDPARWRGLGLAGLRRGSRHGEYWTLRLAGRRGVLGLLFEGEEEADGRLAGAFSAHAFPHPDDPAAEALPLAALALTQSPDYWSLARDFPARPDTGGLFEAARLGLTLDLEGRWLELALDGLSRQRVLAAAGIPLPDGDWLTPPGGRESDRPGFGPALPLLRVLACLLAQALGEPPSRRLLAVHPARAQEFDPAGRWREVPDPDLSRLLLRVGFGPADELPPPGPGQAPARCGARLHQPRPGQTDEAAARPELVILTGFLGAGKTTLLRRLLEDQTSRYRLVGVIQNEIGEVGLDGTLVRGECVLEEMDEGCVCCSLAGQLRAGLLRIRERLVPDLVVLETSGLANPLNVLDELPEVTDLARPGPVVTVADAVNFWAATAESRVALDQVRAADVVVLAKADLVDEVRAHALEARIRDLNPLARVLRSREGWIPWSDILGQAPPERPSRVLALGDLRGGRATHAADRFGVRVERLASPLTEDRLADMLRDAGPMARIKGVVDLAGEEGPVLVQGVRGRVELSVLPGPDPGERFLVFIGRD